MSDKARKVKPRKLDTMVSLRLTSEELQAVHEKAQALGMTLSGYIRHVAITPAVLPFVIYCSVCGEVIIATDRPEWMGYDPLWMGTALPQKTHWGCAA
jgi:hypothetical protein